MIWAECGIKMLMEMIHLRRPGSQTHGIKDGVVEYGSRLLT